MPSDNDHTTAPKPSKGAIFSTGRLAGSNDIPFTPSPNPATTDTNLPQDRDRELQDTKAALLATQQQLRDLILAQSEHSFTRPEASGRIERRKLNILSNSIRLIFSEIPKYEGKGGSSTLRLFIQKMEQYFRLDLMDDAIQAELAATKLEGTAAILWLNHVDTELHNDVDYQPTWHEMKNLLHMYFGNDHDFMNALRKLRSLKHVNSVQHYTTQFNAVIPLLNGALSDRTLMVQYLDNLNDHVKKAIGAVPVNHDSLGICQKAALQFDAVVTSSDHHFPQSARHTAATADVRIAKHGSFNRSSRSHNHHGDRQPHRVSSHWPSTRQPDSTRSNFSSLRKPRNACKFCRSPDHFPSDCPLIPKKLHNQASRNLANRTNDLSRTLKPGGERGAGTASQHMATPTPPQSRALCGFTGKIGHCGRRVPISRPEIIIDSGTTDHMLNDPAHFSSASEDNTPIEVADGKTIHAKAIADVPLTTTTNPGRNISHKNALFVPDFASSLFSISHACDNNATVLFTKDSATICDATTGEVILTGSRHSNLCLLDAVPQLTTSDVKANVAAQPYRIWHQRLTHLNQSSVHQLAKASLIRLCFEEEYDQNHLDNCEACQKAKAKRISHPASDTQYADTLELVHADVVGPMEYSLESNKYVFTWVDHASRYAFTDPALDKTSHTAIRFFKTMMAAAECQTGNKLKIFCMDRGGEYLSESFSDLLRDRGIKH